MKPKIAIDAACGAIRTAGSVAGHSESWSDLRIMTLARDREMQRGGRAERFLNHYLSGIGTPISFSLIDLFSEDSGVAGRVSRKVNEEVQKAEVGGRELIGLTGTVPVHQIYFSNRDWQFATGSLNIQWECRGETVRNTVPLLALDVWCRNIYRWHPEVPRATQCVHQAAVRLQNPKPEVSLDWGNIATRLRSPTPHAQMLSLTKETKPPAAKDFLMVAPRERYFVQKKTKNLRTTS